ncbi:sulfatase-like hydrolase/transferase [Roseibacterium beibuensis]|uniref:Sulfatase N-terminal domain-containing protein n=1 Tax=[Roseibacterium] beibuensis TaxID=1193142 RepID=A0ABP9KTX3_9RHOB|nr:sulfatase-like hydrolase/transferase [Roseibacterium beibuensis]MCS6622137.1 sulfatase-like hydrolase/transferase [Roseibacterium beibuensis]
MSFSPDAIAESHICLIWVDDMIDVYTWRDSFGIRIETPNLDRFMAKAARFSNAYATVPLCAPCRAEIATGLSPFRTGLVDLNRFWRDVMRPERAWQYDLRRAGFYTFTTGKVDSNYQPMPEEYRRILFHEEPAAEDKGKRRGVHAYLDRGPGIKGVNHPDDDGSQDDRFYDHWVAQNAIDFLDRADPTRRSLIQLGFKHPHYNLITPDRFYAQYDPAAIRWPDIAHAEDYFGPQPGFAVYEAAYIANGVWTPEKAGDEAWRQVVRAYFAAISHVDHEIGRFLDALEASPLGQNTTVIFLSDNGFNLGNHDSFHKMSQWDSAAHIPLGIWHPSMERGTEIDMPVSLHNIPKTIMQLAGLPPRPDWTSGQSLLPLIGEGFGRFDDTKSPATSVFGTLSVRPSVEGYRHLRYFRYPNGEEHVYDIETDPGETENLVETAPMEFLRAELVKGALALGLDLRGYENPADGVNAMMAVDGSVILAGGRGDNDYWAYGSDAEKIREEKDGGTDTLWYMAGPDDYVLHCPANVEKIRIATVVSRNEADGKEGKRLKIVAHPDSPIEFETSERVEIDLKGSDGDDIMIGPKHGAATFYGGGGNDLMIAKAKQANRRHAFYGEAGNDTLHGGPGRDTLDGGTGDDVIHGNSGRNHIYGGHGNDLIHDGEGASTIDTGPGRNKLHLGAGDHVVHVGAGMTRIEAEPGAKTFHIAPGGVTIIDGWTPDQRYDLSAWPTPPKLTTPGPQQVRLRTGLTILDLHGVPEGADIAAQIIQPDT